jgi:hypothetical protein
MSTDSSQYGFLYEAIETIQNASIKDELKIEKVVETLNAIEAFRDNKTKAEIDQLDVILKENVFNVAIDFVQQVINYFTNLNNQNVVLNNESVENAYDMDSKHKQSIFLSNILPETLRIDIDKQIDLLKTLIERYVTSGNLDKMISMITNALSIASNRISNKAVTEDDMTFIKDAVMYYMQFNYILNIIDRLFFGEELLLALTNSDAVKGLRKAATTYNDLIDDTIVAPQTPETPAKTASSASSTPKTPATPASSVPVLSAPVTPASAAAPPASAAAPPASGPASRLQVKGVTEDTVDDNVVSVEAPFDETHNNYYVAGNPTRDLQFLSLPNVPHLQVSAQNSSEYRTLLVQAIGTFPAIPSITGLSKKDDAKRLNCTEWFNDYMSDDTNLPDSNTVAGAYIRSEDKALEKARRDEMIMYICDHDAVAKRIMTNVGDTIRKLLDRALMIPQLLAENARLCACVPTDENPMSARAAPAVEAMKNDQKLLMEQLAYMAMQMKKLSDSLDFAYDPADKTFYRKTIDANDQVKEERWNPETDAAHPILGLDMDKVKELWDVLGSAQTGTLYGQKLSVYPVHLSCAGDLVSTPLIHAIITYKTERPIATVGANDKITIARMYLLRLFDLIRNLGDKDKIKAVFQAAVNDTVMLEQMSKYITLTSGSIKVWIRLPFDFFKTHAKDVFALFAKNPDTADLIAPKDEDQLISYTNWQLALTSMALRPVNISLSQEFGLDQDPNMQLWMQDIARLPKDGIELAFMSYEELDEREFAEPGIRSALSADDLQLRKMQRQIERELNQKENDAIEEAEIRRVTKDKPDMQQAQLLALQEKIKRRNERQNIVAESVEGYEAALNSLEREKHVKLVPNLQPLPKTVYDLISMGPNFQKDAKELTRVVNKQGFDQQKQANAMTASTEAMQIYNLSKQAKDLMNAFYAAPDSTVRKDIVARLAQILVNVSIAHGKYVSARVVAIPDTTI